MTVARTKLLALVAALFVVLPLNPGVRDRFLCSMMGRVTTACCCASSPSGLIEASCPDDEIGRQDCCQKLENGARGAPALRDGALRLSAATAALAAPLSTAPLTPDPGVIRAEAQLARPPPQTGPPIFIAHCALLT